MKGKGDSVSETVVPALNSLVAALENTTTPTGWAGQTPGIVAAFRQSITASGLIMPPLVETHLAAIAEEAANISNDDKAHGNARNWAVNQLPVFIYLDDYPELEGHQDVPELLKRRQENRLTQADHYFLKLAKVAGLDPQELHNLLSQDHETRQQLTNRAGAVVTRKIRELWKDRELTIRFNLDANHFDTLVSDSTSYYPVEVNLNERSRGFKWFFSFYITFAADTQRGPAENAILLLDEPGLYLDAMAQRNLLDHFAHDFDNQIIYTTHSPFMIPVNDLPAIRTVNISPDHGTSVSNDPMGDALTLFPIQAALGYDLTQTLFVGDKNLVVEGVSDFWYLSSTSDYFKARSLRP